jgi:starch synthase (maltosyl-transferring)
MSPEKRSSRVIIENIDPELDGGRYPVKRCVGDRLEISADIFMDGHDLIRSVFLWRGPEESAWNEIELEHISNDRWRGSFLLTQVGVYSFTLKAWPDRFASWMKDIKKRDEAGQDISLDISEGKILFEKIAKDSDKKGRQQSPLQKAHVLLDKGSHEEIKNFLLSDEALALYRKHDPREGEASYNHTLRVRVDRKRAEFGAWYEMFPRSQGKEKGKSATFADCEHRLADIRKMGFDVVYLPPIHPIGFLHRKGKNNALKAEAADPGSPYAIGSKQGGHKNIHPELGTLEDFQHFVKAAETMGMEVALDFAVQVSRDHPYIASHPEWFSFRSDGTLKYAENPPKKYQDIANFDFSSGHDLWEELKSIVQFWIDQGVTIFRVDNPHTKPFAFWEWLIEDIQSRHPDVIFLSEAFARPKIMYLLAKIGFTQSYTYFTWRSSKQELTDYLTELTFGAVKEYFRPNFFPTTPDILPQHLHHSGRPGFIIRLTLAATLATSYGIYNGYELCEAEALPETEEYANSEKYEHKVRDWDAPGNIKDFITNINKIRNENPALQEFKALRFYPASNDQILFYGKMTADKKSAIFIVVNLDPFNVQEALIDMPIADLGIAADKPYALEDLLLGHGWKWTGARQYQHLDPHKNPVAIFRIQSL